MYIPIARDRVWARPFVLVEKRGKVLLFNRNPKGFWLIEFEILAFCREQGVIRGVVRKKRRGVRV